MAEINELNLSNLDEINIILKIREIDRKKNTIYIEEDIMQILNGYDKFAEDYSKKMGSRVAINWDPICLKNALKLAYGRQAISKVRSIGGRKSRIECIQEEIRSVGYKILFDKEEAEKTANYLSRYYAKSTIYEALRNL